MTYTTDRRYLLRDGQTIATFTQSADARLFAEAGNLLEHMKETGAEVVIHPTIEELMDAMAADAWCVVLKRLPPDFPWIFDDSPQSEYDGGGGRIHEVARNQWCCHAQDMRQEGMWRHDEWTFAETARKAVEAMAALLKVSAPAAALCEEGR